MFDVEVVAIVAVAFLVAGFVKGVVGLGLPVISIAILSATVGLKAAVALFLVPAMVTNIWQALTGGNLFTLVRRLWPLLITAIGGIWIGVKILVAADVNLIATALGVVLVVYALLGLFQARMPKPGSWEPWLTPVIGAMGGVMFGMMGNFMVPGVLYIQSLGLPRDMFVQALGLTFLIISSTLAIVLSRHALMPIETAMLSAGALIPTMVGMFLGQKIRRLLSEAQFARVVFVAIGLSGVYMIVRAFFASGLLG
ncbi:MAG TPA: sulfite exporter TauE/SafE family protein [Hyphomicrobiaceae bacterium]|nr:sulfite exporter TauE/SafE family protein [Hyphomicrobiaceae bacterium]